MRCQEQLADNSKAHFGQCLPFLWGVCSGVARAFPGGQLAHPEGQNEEENEKSLRKNK